MNKQKQTTTNKVSGKNQSTTDVTIGLKQLVEKSFNKPQFLDVKDIITLGKRS